MAKGTGTTRSGSAVNPTGVGTQSIATGGGNGGATISLGAQSMAASSGANNDIAKQVVNSAQDWKKSKKEATKVFDNLEKLSQEDNKKYWNASVGVRIHMKRHSDANLDNIEHYLNKKGIKTEPIAKKVSDTGLYAMFPATTKGITFKIAGNEYALSSESSYPWGTTFTLYTRNKEIPLGLKGNNTTTWQVFNKMSTVIKEKL